MKSDPSAKLPVVPSSSTPSASSPLSVELDALPVTEPVQKSELSEVAARLENAPPQDILRWGVENHSPGLVMACSFGMQSCVMIDMLASMGFIKQIPVFYLDTGVLFAETHQTRLRIQERYGFRAIRIAAELSWEDQQAQYGGNLYEQGMEGVNKCCEIRKTLPTHQYLSDKTAWITGMRRGHSPTRKNMPVVLWDDANDLVKLNPVALFDDATLWGYIKANNVPFNPLYDQGYPSIGCDTSVCTRQVKPGDDPRSGRWSGMDKTECGIHLDGAQIKSLDSSKL